MPQFFIVYLNDARIVGPFPSEPAAHAWAKRTPNSLFADAETYEHADGNGDFWVSAAEEPPPPGKPSGPSIKPAFKGEI